MQILTWMINAINPFLPTFLVLLLIIISILMAHYIFEKRFEAKPGQRFRYQLITLLLSFIGLIMIILVLPVNDTLRGQILSLIGILLSAAIALSATTFVGNAMAGILLKTVRNFRMGDFIRVGDYFGRVSEQGLFHVEIQTEDRDLTTMPNLYLVTNPVKVIRSSGTIIHAEVSLGYDVARTKIETLLLQAAKAAELKDAFVYVMELGDFSITYRISGLLEEVKQVISARSRLREMVIDTLHEGGVEIVSPNFMNTRAVKEGKMFIPQKEYAYDQNLERPSEEKLPETMLFDKAEEAESLEKLREVNEKLSREYDEIKERLKQIEVSTEQEKLKAQMEKIEERKKRIIEYLKAKEG
ncbi:MAG: mechanosensitive ion channel domain-containing protein [bacterium]